MPELKNKIKSFISPFHEKNIKLFFLLTAGMTADDIRYMSEDDLLDMDYFLNEDDLFYDEAGVEGFYIF